MDTETLFTATKWEILKLLEEEPLAPIELSERLGSSLANVSQQLKLLELAGIVVSERIPNRDKGQPRTKFKLAGDLSYMIATADNFVDKKAVLLSGRNKVVLRIWFLEDPALRYSLEKAFWELEPHLSSISKITYAGMEDGSPVLELSGTQRLAASIEVGEGKQNVTVRSMDDPVGYVLYEQ